MPEFDEVIEGEPVEEIVLAEVHEIEPAAHGGIPAVQAAAMTAGGFFAGALAMAMVKRLAARRLGELPSLPDGGRWPVGASRTYVVNVRLISRSSE